MIKTKHFLDQVEEDDGLRIWVEPFGLTRDLCKWCDVGMIFPDIGPPRPLWNWFDQHPDGYEYFRGMYHDYLASGRFKALLERIVRNSERMNITLLHQSEDECQNTATALYEFLDELRAYEPPETW